MALSDIRQPSDLANLSFGQLAELASEIREFIVEAVAKNSGHLGSNLGAVELTLALHRVFESPRDAILWDTGHQAYVHKIVTGRRGGFSNLRQAGGISGYPSREESVHDFIENSHASTVLSYAYGLSVARDAGQTPDRQHIVAVIGDGSLTGGMAYEALNNLGHAKRRVIIVLNDNGRSYAPTISNLISPLESSAAPSAIDPKSSRLRPQDRLTRRLSRALTFIRLNPVYVRRQRKLEKFLSRLPVVGPQAERGLEAFKAGIREFLQPTAFFEALGVRYIGPINGHNQEELEQAFAAAKLNVEEGPLVIHVITQKGRGYAPAEDDDEKNLHDAPIFDPIKGPPKSLPTGYTQAFADTIPFQSHFPDRFIDVGIAEQHAVTAAAGMAMGGLRPVVALYSTFLNRAWDQIVYDVALHRLPVVFCLDRAGITGDDGPSHNGIFDMALLSKVPGMRLLAPSSAQDLSKMLEDAIALAETGPVAIRYPKGIARVVGEHEVGSGLSARKLRSSAVPNVCVLAVGKMVSAAEKAAELLSERGIEITLWDVRSCVPADEMMISDASKHCVVVTIEDGIRDGGIGMMLADAVTNIQGSVNPRIEVLGLPTKFLMQAKPAVILKQLGLDADSLVTTIAELATVKPK